MNETEIVKPGEKKVQIIVPPVTLVGKPPDISLAWFGFENPNETMTRMEIASLLVSLANMLLNQEYQAAMPKQRPVIPIIGLDN